MKWQKKINRLKILIFTVAMLINNAAFPQTNNISHYDFNYPDRSSFLADGWNFDAVRTSGALRNTEQTTGAVISFDQTLHPGTIQVPVDQGDLWASTNDTRNSIFRDLPSDWTSIRVLIEAFDPSQNYQQAGLVVYENDDNYVQITRSYEYGNKFALIREVQGGAWTVASQDEEATSNLYYRLDRDTVTDMLTAFYSLDGNNWQQLGGNVDQQLDNSRLGIIFGSSPGGYPIADLAWAEVYSGTAGGVPVTTSMVLSDTSLNFITNEGQNPAAQPVSVSSSIAEESFSWSASVSGAATWLNLSSSSGTSGSSTDVQVDASGLVSGDYTGTITFSSGGVSNSPQTLEVNLSILAGDQPVLSLSQGSIDLSVEAGANLPSPVQISVTNTGNGDVINWTATSDASWLTATSGSGITPGAFSIQADQTGMSAGIYNGSITVSSPEAVNGDQIVNVRMEVLTAAVPVLALSTSNIGFSVIENGLNPNPRSFTITNAGSASTIDWIASVDVSWLSLSTFEGSTPDTVTVSVDQTGLNAGTYSGLIGITATQTGDFELLNVTLNINPEGTQHIDFDYADRGSLLADGWDFLAETASGSTRNTEQTSGAVVSYDQGTHPGVIRIPVDDGDLWGQTNNTRNSLFRDIPETWTTVRMLIQNFNPVQNYQAAGMVVYSNDDSYVQISRGYENGNQISLNSEVTGSPFTNGTVGEEATGNIYLRLERDHFTETISASYSLDGINWTGVGSVDQSITNPRLAVITGGTTNNIVNCDIAWVEIESGIVDELRAYPNDLVFHAVEGQNPEFYRTIHLTSTLGNAINWTFSTDVPWLSAAYSGGQTDTTLIVNANTSGLSAGVYTGTVNLSSPQSIVPVISIPVSFIVNPDVGVTASTWWGGRKGAMSVSVDDGANSGYDLLLANDFSGTFVTNGSEPPAYYNDMYLNGMELGAHLYSHICQTWTDDLLRYQEIEPNIDGIINYTTQPASELITMVWPCGENDYKGQAVAAEYFLAGRGYNYNEFEDATPQDFMDIKSFNSWDDNVLPPPTNDFIGLVDSAITLGKWYNLVLHFVTNDFGAIEHAKAREDSVWVSSIGGVVKYIMQRNRFVLSNYSYITDTVRFSVSRIPVPASVYREFEPAFTDSDVITLQIDVDDFRTIENLLVDGNAATYTTTSIGGNTVILLDVLLEPDVDKSVELIYRDETLPRFYFNPASLTFNAQEGQNPADQSVVLSTSGGGNINWNSTLVNSSPWLTVSPAAGTEQDTVVTLTVSSAGLTAGTYTDTIAFSSVDAANSPQTVQVSFVLDSASLPTIAATPESLSFGASVNGVAPPAQQITVLNSETLDILGWTASADVAWISLSSTSGTTPGVIDVNIDHSALADGDYTGTITVASGEASNLYMNIPVYLRVTPEGTQRIEFNYADRASLIADGWDFIGRTAGGVDRNTEQDTGAVVSYDQALHPGVIRVPVDQGDLWGTANDTRNTLFRDLPSSWTSVTLMIASFNPTSNYQQAGLVIYDTDDHYVQLTRHHSNGNFMTFARELQGSAWIEASVAENATTNLHYRIDRVPADDSLFVYYSLDGSNWIQVGTGIVQGMNNPRLAIVTGASPSGYPNADIAWVEINSELGSEFTVTPSNLSYTTLQGSNPASQVVVLSTNGSANINWSTVISNGAEWLSLSPDQGQNGDSISVSINTSGLIAGSYSDVISFVSSEATNSPQTVNVDLLVEQVTEPTIDVSAGHVSFSMTEGAALPGATSVTISNNSTSDTLTWTASADVSWISLVPDNGTTPGVIAISVDTTALGSGIHTGLITISSAEASNGNTSIGVSFNIDPEGTQRYSFDYADRASLLADGWDFMATTVAGVDRNTEQTSGAVVSYDQALHPGVIRIPVDEGDLWGTANSTRNSLFRDLPGTWISIRLMIAAFNPTQNYQQAGLVLYDNDDSYVQLTRHYSSANRMTFAQEAQGSAWIEASVAESATTNLYYRIDRDQLTDLLTAYYSLDGINWIQVGNSITRAMINPRFGVVVGASSGGFPNADIAWAEVIAAAEPVVPPVLAVSPLSLSFTATAGDNLPLTSILTLSNSGNSEVISCNITDNADWLSLSSATATTPSDITVSVDPTGLAEGSYTGTISISSPEVPDGTQTVAVTFDILSSASNFLHIDFDYADRAGLLADGWDFIATTPSGSARNTEQTSGAVVSYDQLSHPGVLRIPADEGDLWASMNNTRNSLFRDLPSDWTSVRLLITAFNPTQSYQQAGLVIYENDDNYVQITRIYAWANVMSLAREQFGSAWNVISTGEWAVTNIYYRFDRDPLTETLTAYYSVDGENWTQLSSSFVQGIENPRLAIIVGSSPGGLPDADIAWAEIYAESSNLKALGNNTAGISEPQMQETDNEAKLYQNYPNPFDDFTWVEFDLVEDDNVIIEVYSSTGQLVKKIDSEFRAGKNQIMLNTNSYKPGTYFLRFNSKQLNSTIMMNIIR